MAATTKWHYNHAMPIEHPHSFFAQWVCIALFLRKIYLFFYGDEFASWQIINYK